MSRSILLSKLVPSFFAGAKKFRTPRSCLHIISRSRPRSILQRLSTDVFLVNKSVFQNIVVSRCFCYASTDVSEFIESVKTALKSSDGYVKDRQMLFLNAVFNDISNTTTTQLLTKLNCESNLSGAEMYDLAVAVFQHRNEVTGGENIAAAMFEYSGELGDTNALYTFAQLLTTGQGVPRDMERSSEIMTQLSMKGHPYAQFALAAMYYNGSGVEQNFKRAFTLYKVSSQNYIPQALNMMGHMYKNGQGIPEDIDEAIKCFEKGAELGDPSAHLSLGHCYTHGKGVKTSTEKAFHHHQEASKSGHPVALYNLGVQYFAGKGTEQSFEKAAEVYKQAADAGFSPAQVNLGNMYYSGMGVSKDRDKAKELYKLAAVDDKNAQTLLEEVENEEKKEMEATDH